MIRLKELRTSSRKSQKDMANMFNVDRTTYGKWELNISKPDIDTVIQLANYFNVTTDYLLGVENTVKNTPNNTAKEEEMKDTTGDEFKLLHNYRQLDDNDKDTAQRFISTMAISKGQKDITARG